MPALTVLHRLIPAWYTAHTETVLVWSVMDLEGTKRDVAKISPSLQNRLSLFFHWEMNMYIHISINIPIYNHLYLYLVKQVFISVSASNPLPQVSFCPLPIVYLFLLVYSTP